MCEWTDSKHKNQAFAFMKDRDPNQVISPFIKSRFSYAMNKGHCPKCGKFLSERERNPKGRATRSMCQNCYEGWIANRVNTNCFVCDIPLPLEKIEAQYENTREIANHIHDGACSHIWTIIHNVANDDSEHGQYQIPQHEIPKHQRVPNYSLGQTGRQLGNQPVIQLGYESQTSVNDFIDKNYQFWRGDRGTAFVQAKKTTNKMRNGKPVRVIRKLLN